MVGPLIRVAPMLLSSLAFTCITRAQPLDSLWQMTCGGGSPDYGYSVRRADDGGCALAGHTSSFGVGGYDVYLVKTNVDGDSLSVDRQGLTLPQVTTSSIL